MSHWGLALVMAMLLPAEVASAPSVTVRVLNLAELDRRDLATGLSEAGAVYEQAGISVTWVICGPCDAPATATTLWLRVAISPLATGTTLGEAPLHPTTKTGVVATVYTDRVSRLAREAGRRVERFLGVIIAHELGHLLMGSLTHERHTGIMRRAWSIADLRSAPHFAFTPRERSDLRTGLSQRETTDQP